MAESPKPVGYWCDHTDEPRGQRTHEGWDLTDTGQEWTRQPDTISSHTGATDWDPEQRHCPRAVPVYAVDAPALVADLNTCRTELTMWRESYDRLALAARRFRWAWQSAQRGRRKARDELTLAMGPRMYSDVQKVLDGALGGRREDGAGAGLVTEIRLLAERMTAAEAEAERLEAEGVDRMAERFMEQTRIRSMEIRDGMNLDLEPARELVAGWVGAARTMLGAAPNYSETRVDVPTDDDPKISMEVKLAGELDRYVFVLQRVGGMTPHEARMKAEAERDDLRVEVEERGKALADWQRVAGQHQAAMFDAKNRADHLVQQIQNLWTVKVWTNEDRRKFVFVEDLLNALQPDLAPDRGPERVSLAQQRQAVIALIRDAYADANVELKDGDPWPTWGPSIDALDILRALGTLEGTTTLAGEHRD